MLRGQMICLGSCIDYQKVARASALQSHPERNLFDTLATRQLTSAADLRMICVRHQVEVVDERLAAADPDSDALKELRTRLLRIVDEASRGRPPTQP